MQKAVLLRRTNKHTICSLFTHGGRAGTMQIVTIALRDMQRKTPYKTLLVQQVYNLCRSVRCELYNEFVCECELCIQRAPRNLAKRGTARLHCSTQTHRPDKQTHTTSSTQQPHGVPHSRELHTSTTSCFCCATTFSQYFADSRCCRFDGTATVAASILVAVWLSLPLECVSSGCYCCVLLCELYRYMCARLLYCTCEFLVCCCCIFYAYFWCVCWKPADTTR